MHFLRIVLVLSALPLALTAQEQRVSLYLEEGKSGTVWDVALGPGGKTAYSCGRDSTAKSWNLLTGECIRTFRAPEATLNTCLAVDRDGKILLVGDMHGRIQVWNEETGALLETVSAHSKYVLDVAFSSDQTFVASCGRDDSVKIWDARTFRLRRALRTDALWVNSIAISADSKTIATGGQDGSVSLWDATTGALIRKLGTHDRYVRSVCFTQDGKFLFSGSRGGDIKVWDIKRQAQDHQFFLEQGSPHHLALDGKGVRLVASTMDGVVEIWDWKKSVLIRKLEAASYGSMVSSPDPAGVRLFTGHTDGAVKAWNMDDGLLLCNFVGFSDGQWLSFTPDGFYDCSTYGDRYVSWKQGERFFPLDRYSSIYRSASTIEDALGGQYRPESGFARVIDPPRATIQSPRQNQLFAFGGEEPQAIVEVEAVDAKRIERIQLSLNGRPLRDEGILEERTLVRTDTSLRMRFRIAVLPGTNTIEATAYNAARVKSDPARCTVKVETSEQPRPNLYVVSVGVDHYAPALPDLNYSVIDAEQIASVLAAQEGKMYGRVYGTVLTDKSASRKGILDALEALPKMTPQDVFVLFFSGHGMRGRDAKGRTRYYYVTPGTSSRTLAKQGLAWDDVVSKLGHIRAGRVILFLDACHSGAVSQGASNEKVAAALSREIGIVFASSSGNEYAFENRTWGHGAFTRALLDAFAGAADLTKDNIVDWSELQLYVVKRVKELTAGGQNPTIPLLEQFADFNFIRVR